MKHLLCIVFLFFFRSQLFAQSTPVVNVGALAGVISACQGTTSEMPNIGQFTLSGHDLTAPVTITAPPGFEVSEFIDKGYSNSISIGNANGVLDNRTIYIRLTANNLAGNISGKLNINTSGAADQTMIVSGIVYGLPTVNPITNKSIPNGTTTTPISITGDGNTFTWTNDNPAIGLGTSGTGDIPSFTAINTTSSPVTAHVHVTSNSKGEAFLTDYYAGTVIVFNTTTNSVTNTIPVENSPLGPALSPDGSKLYVINHNYFTTNKASISVINTNTQMVTATLTVGYDPEAMIVSPDNTKLYVVDSEIGKIYVVDTDTNQINNIIQLAFSTYPVQPAITPDGKTLYTINSNYNSVGLSVSVIDLVNNIVVKTIPLGHLPDDFYAEARDIQVSHNGKFVYVSNETTKGVTVISTSSNTVIDQILTSDRPAAIEISPDDKRMYVTDHFDRYLRVVDLTANKVIATVTLSSADLQFPESSALTKDGSLLYVKQDNAMIIVNTVTNTVVEAIPLKGGAGWGNFLRSGSNCSGSSADFEITVTGIAPVLTIGTLSGGIQSCQGSPSNKPNIEQFSISGKNLTNLVKILAPAGFEVSANADNGYGPLITLNGINGNLNSATIYVRSAASAQAGNITGNVSVRSAGAADQSVVVSAQIDALPTIDAIANQNVVSGALTKAINFNGTATTYSWVNDTPMIGLASSGTGNILPFIADNNTNNPLVAKITVTPLSDKSCNGTPIFFNITVDPTQTTTSVSPLSIPNAFTPNGDGRNDTWEIKDLANYPKAIVSIFNRFGQELYTSVGYSKPWDGKHNGIALPAGVYYYIINLQNNQPVTSGWVAIIL